MNDTAPTGLALYVIEEHRTTATSNSRRVVRIDFDDGRAVGRASLAEGDGNFYSHFGGCGFFEDRVIYTHEGGVVDLTAGRAVVEPAGTVLGVDGRLLVVREWNVDGVRLPSVYLAVDLESFQTRYLTRPGVWGLPGKRSPDGLRSVSHQDGDLYVHGLGGGSRRLAEGISAQDPGGTGAEPPILWLDAERVLTQRRNGLLIVVDLDGDVRSEIDLRLDGEPRQPRLWFDRAGQVVYECHTRFRIRPEDREWGLYEEEPLGNGFFLDVGSPDEAAGPRAVRHLGVPLGDFHTGDASSCPGHLALSVRRGTRPLTPGDLHVWSEHAGWQHIGLNLNSIVGWIDQREGR